MLARVAFPVIDGAYRLFVETGKKWSAIEQLLLFVIADSPDDANGLAVKTGLPRQIVLEAVIRFMRMGWAEFVEIDSRVCARLTAHGLAAATEPDPPALPRPKWRKARFVIDGFVGTVHTPRGFRFERRANLEARKKAGEPISLITGSSNFDLDPYTIIEKLLRDHERLIRFEDTVGGKFRRYALATVVGDRIEGIPDNAPIALRQMIQSSALKLNKRVKGYTPSERSRATSQQPADPKHRLHDIAFDSTKDIIIGGGEHKDCFERAISDASHWLVIHSTFLDQPESIRKFAPLLLKAAERGVRTDILHSVDSQAGFHTDLPGAVDAWRRAVDGGPFSNRITVHRHSTGSHAKIILVDPGMEGGRVIVGSCNWLTSQFRSIEASLCLRDPIIVGEVASHLAAMSSARTGLTNQLGKSLVMAAAECKSTVRTGGKRARACLVLGSEHASWVRYARDSSARRILVVSHRLGAAGEVGFLIPAGAAAASNVEVTAVYERISGPVTGDEAARLIREARAKGITLQPLQKDRMHAKVLLWDDDHAIVTSQNWLSADPPDSSPRAEIGIYIESKSIARLIAGRLQFGEVSGEKRRKRRRKKRRGRGKKSSIEQV